MTEEQKGAPPGAPGERVESDDTGTQAAPRAKVRGATFPLVHTAIEHTEFETAEEFLAAVSPLNLFWQPNPSAWIFRGHAVAEWRLLASALRGPEAFAGLDSPPRGSGDLARLEEAARPTNLLSRFQHALDAAGMAIPAHGPPRIRTVMEMALGIEEYTQATPLEALAQHLGLPTTLLDWSFHAKKAAYFAAADAAKDKDSTGNMCVWALKYWVFRSPTVSGLQDSSFNVVTAPRATNPNLHAQAGIFTTFRGNEVTTVDEYARHVATSDREASVGLLRPRQDFPLMRRLSVPRSCAPRLLRYLSYEGINASTMFPGYAGVVESLREQVRWDSPHSASKSRSGEAPDQQDDEKGGA